MGSTAHELKVLVADDSAVYRKLVENTLAEENHIVIFAKNGREALDLFAKHQPSLVITDWTMPDITGIELCQSIRRDFQQYYAYVILLTSHADKKQLIEGLAAGADDYLTKPFDPGELLARIRVGRRIADLNREIQDKNRQLEELALTDPLTGLSNRRAIDIWATRQLNGAARHNFPLWAGIADLDNFKRLMTLMDMRQVIQSSTASLRFSRLIPAALIFVVGSEARNFSFFSRMQNNLMH
jgi:PleD family two-component response regulator